ncbi:hypothetical protein PR202_ga06105 [Eleusine coracana subsp. coracana]|uniref:Uncharacterized protein n=1 Tax=Eleusine coracana subsp. coracana TaxID=191504 RepID=A0AAV5BU66_ELECO|nr:hypothetical protein PR202_ga06105 [Eleusine coracana subsp. coracana]
MPICSCEETINEFEAFTRDAGRVQRDTLKKILELNGGAEYLKHFGLGGRTDVESYKSLIPLCVHSDLEPYIQRIVDGDRSPVLTGKPITSLSLSSGTTQGKPKFLPFNDELLETTLQIFRTSYAFRNRQSTRNVWSLSNWYGVIPALWPNAKYVYGIMTGSMEPYLKKLRHYSGHLPLISADYGASEGWVGANIDPTKPPEEVTYAVLPHTGYFEFIPLEKPNGDESENNASIHYIESEPVGLTEVEVDKIYEVVITTFGGLYRYRLGDIVKIANFHNSTPELRFICRRSLVLSINIDKNTEKDLQLAVEDAAKLLEGYVGSRKINTIGPLELRILRKGTFKEILDHFLSLGGAVSQFKAPRFVSSSNLKVLEILSRNTTAIYSSTAYGR